MVGHCVKMAYTSPSCGSFSSAARYLLGGNAFDLFEHAGKIELVKKADGDRDFGDGKPGVFQQGTRFADAVAR